MKKRTMKIVAAILITGWILGMVGVGALVWYVHRTIRENCRLAQQAYPHPGDDIAALVDFMNSPSHSFLERTHVAIWTLGQLRDPKALPALESAYTGEPCDHDKGLCQYELGKAIKLCGGVPNPPRKKGH